MEAEELRQALRLGPVRIRMNNGDEFVVPHTEFISVGDYTAALLVRGEKPARHRIVSLMNISDVEILSVKAESESA